MPYSQTGPSYSRQGGSKSLSTSSSRSIDYSGLDEHVQRQDAVASARDAKKAALYGGDPMQAMLAGNRVRELVSLLSRDAPGTTEQNPHVLKSPLARVTSQSGSFSTSSSPGGSSYTSPSYQYAPEPKNPAAAEQAPPPDAAPQMAPEPAPPPLEPMVPDRNIGGEPPPAPEEPPPPAVDVPPPAPKQEAPMTRPKAIAAPRAEDSEAPSLGLRPPRKQESQVARFRRRLAEAMYS